MPSPIGASHRQSAQTIANPRKPSPIRANHRQSVQTIANPCKPSPIRANHRQPAQTIANPRKPSPIRANHRQSARSRHQPRRFRAKPLHIHEKQLPIRQLHLALRTGCTRAKPRGTIRMATAKFLEVAIFQ
jgi:hypothetical protein